jgi:hypothetical protein
MPKKTFTIRLLNSSSYEVLEPVKIHAAHILRTWDENPDAMTRVMEDIREQEQERTQRFSEVDEVFQALTTASFRRDEKTGIIEKGQQGPTQIPWKIVEVRKNSLIKGLITRDIERQLELGLSETEIDEVVIKLNPEYTYHLAGLMVTRLKFSTVAAEPIVKLYDKMVDWESEAQKIVKKEGPES